MDTIQARLGAGLLLSLATLPAAQSDALTIHLPLIVPGSSLANVYRPERMAVIRDAADWWEVRVRDPITVHIDVDTPPFNTDDEGPYLFRYHNTAHVTHRYEDVRQALIADAGSSAESTAASSLPAFKLPIVDCGGATDAGYITMTTANAKALGLGASPDASVNPPPQGFDAQIWFSPDEMDKAVDGRVTNPLPYQIDLFTLARQRIGEVLGFTSGVDERDFQGPAGLGSIDCGSPSMPNPATMDIWRFSQSGGAHDLTNEPRRLTFGPAEYYDSVQNNIPMSWGLWSPTITPSTYDPSCNWTADALCVAHAWRFDQGLMMSPYPRFGQAGSARPQDAHAINYIGYDNSLYPALKPALSLQWVLSQLVLSRTASSAHKRRDLPPVPALNEQPDFDANVGLHLAMNLGDLGNRSGVGLANFVPAHIVVVEDLPEGVVVEPGREFPRPVPLQRYEVTIPAAITDLYFESDGVAGVPFRFRSTCGQDGCQFDPRIGAHGGYRVAGTIDAMADETNDVDARFVLELAADEHGIPDAEAQNVFTVDESSPDSWLFINDNGAFGLNRNRKASD